MKRVSREIIKAGLIILGIFSAAFGLKGFLLSSHFIDGGVTGISMLLANVTGFPLAILILAINLPFIALGLRQVGKLRLEAIRCRHSTQFLAVSCENLENSHLRLS